MAVRKTNYNSVLGVIIYISVVLGPTPYHNGINRRRMDVDGWISTI